MERGVWAMGATAVQTVVVGGGVTMLYWQAEGQFLSESVLLTPVCCPPYQV